MDEKEKTKAYQFLAQMYEVIERATYKPPRECFNVLVRYLADCVRLRPLPVHERSVADRLWPLTMPFIEAFYKEPQDYLGTLFSEKGCGIDKLAQLITPRSIVRYINEATIGAIIAEKAESQEWISVMDPCTGTGRFLPA